MTSVGDIVEKMELSCVADGHIKWYDCFEEHIGVPLNVKHRVTMTQQFHS